jgi:DNA-binding GntR family transcriptional regulator
MATPTARSKTAKAAPLAEFAPADAAEERPVDLTATAYEQLRSSIMRGQLKPGDKLAAEMLRQRFNFGSTPIREALNRLLAEGWVALEAKKGFRVAPVTEQELIELVTARSWIDGAAVAEAIRRRDLHWEEGLLIALHRLSRAVRRPSGDSAENAEWEQRHRQFHQALVSGCGTHWIMRISEQLFDAAERYRLLAADAVPERDELDEHRAIIDACLAGDVALAVDLLTRHYSATSEVIVRSLHGRSGKSEPAGRSRAAS